MCFPQWLIQSTETLLIPAMWWYGRQADLGTEAMLALFREKLIFLWGYNDLSANHECEVMGKKRRKNQKLDESSPDTSSHSHCLSRLPWRLGWRRHRNCSCLWEGWKPWRERERVSTVGVWSRSSLLCFVFLCTYWFEEIWARFSAILKDGTSPCPSMMWEMWFTMASLVQILKSCLLFWENE